MSSRPYYKLLSDYRPSFFIVNGTAVMDYVESLDGFLEIVFLPPYAPDLNPDELVWNHMRNIGTSKKPLKEGESLMNRAFLKNCLKQSIHLSAVNFP